MTNQELRELNRNRRIYQIAFLTRDLRKSMAAWVDELRVGPWTVFTLTDDNVTNLYVDGGLVTEAFKWLVGISWMGSVQIELIEPIYGPTSYDRFLELKGEGLHHIKEKINDSELEATIAAYGRRGIGVLQRGEFAGDIHCNLDSEEKLGFILELGNCPTIELPPGMYWTFPQEDLGAAAVGDCA